MSLVLGAGASGLVALGTYLVLQRTLTRIILGLGLIGNGVNLLLLAAGGRAGVAPFVESIPAGARVADPLAQALVLTAIVIGFGMTVFLLALAHRSWFLTQNDEVEDDLEDRRLAERARARSDAAHAEEDDGLDFAEVGDDEREDLDPDEGGAS